MTLDEMQAETYRIKELLAEKSKIAKVDIRISSNARVCVYLWLDEDIVRHGLETFHADSIEDVIAKACAYIAELPIWDQRALTKYRGKLANALDGAKEDGLDDKYTKGARQSMTVVSEALLPAPEASE